MWRDLSPYVWLPLSVLCTVFLLFFLVIPSGHSVRIYYDVQGDFAALEAIPAVISDEIRKDAAAKDVTCRAARSPTHILCSGFIRSRTGAARASQILAKDLPETLGWIRADEIRKRLEAGRMERKQLERRLSQAEAAAQEAQAPEVPVKRGLSKRDRLERRVAELEFDLSNRRRQLEAVSREPEGDVTANVRALYERKRSDLARNIGELQDELQTVTGSLRGFSASPEDRDRILKERDQLQVDVASLQKRLVTYESAGTRIADPDSFQVTPIPDSMTSESSRPLTTLLWAPWLGFLLLLALRRNPMHPFRDDVFRNAEEVARETGLALLLELP